MSRFQIGVQGYADVTATVTSQRPIPPMTAEMRIPAAVMLPLISPTLLVALALVPELASICQVASPRVGTLKKI